MQPNDPQYPKQPAATPAQPTGQPTSGTMQPGVPVIPQQVAQPQPVAPLSIPPSQPLGPQPSPATQPPQPIDSAPSPDSQNNDDEREGDGPPAWRRALGFIISWIVIPGLLVLFVHNFVFQAWYVDGQSMEPTFSNGDYLIVSKWETSFKKLTGQAQNISIKRGDVVIFNPQGYASEIFFIKRAIALPGERVVVKDGYIRIYNAEHPNGFILNEPYTGNIRLEGDVDRTVEPGYLFVVGDNRNPNASHDSRAIGPIQMDHIIGTANLRLLPVSHFGVIEHPTYETNITSTTNPSPALRSGRATTP